jgi:hypothetical protein
MKRFMSIRVTICEGSSIHGAHLYYSDDEAGLELSTYVSYEEGMKQLRQLERLLKKPAQMTINEYDPAIAYKDLYGYIDRE